MVAEAKKILDVLRDNGINPEIEGADVESPELPDVGEVVEGERIYTASLDEVLAVDLEDEGLDETDPRLREWLSELEEITSNDQRRRRELRPIAPEPHCAWYCPIHFFGHGWGIYIREQCILEAALDIASFVNWRSVKLRKGTIANHLLRSAFYIFFLHEQFHHKVESFGLRLLVATGTDRYRPYKKNVYRRVFGTSGCLEESLANAESYRRLTEDRYSKRVDPIIRAGVRDYLKASMAIQPSGYREGLKHLTESTFKKGLHHLQSSILEGAQQPKMTSRHWEVAPNMITALKKIVDDIYVVLPAGAKPIFTPSRVDPGVSVSSRDLERALVRYHGYRVVSGGKGSHVKLHKLGSSTVILPGNRPVLSLGVIKSVLQALGGYPLSRTRDLLLGKLA